ncbi:clavesin-2-like [Musca vetustissima]|uniref:clavesin-2-like n=1 Tax=Musca vetustissima TaxID=27455 RepID=UPI002AB5DF14|nr:clavesin-2-like [Musca vetustissima]
MVFLPGLTPDKYRASVLRISNPDPNMMDHLRDIKTYFMVSDYRFALPDGKDPTTGNSLLALGEIIIIDMQNFTMKHMTRVSIRALRVSINYLQRGYPVRIKSIHLINCPPYMNKIISFVRPFLSKQILELLHFHNENLELLYNYVPKEMLTEEYGGPARKMSDHKDQLLQSLIDTRNYLMNHDYWKV